MSSTRSILPNLYPSDDYIDVLFYLRYLGGSFIELTTHAYFILNFSKFSSKKCLGFFLLHITLEKKDLLVYSFKTQLLCYTGFSEHRIKSSV